MNPPRMNSRRWFWAINMVLCGWMLLGVRGTPAGKESPGFTRRIEGGIDSIASVLMTPLSASTRWIQVTANNAIFSRRTDVDQAYVKQLEQDNQQLKNLIYLLYGQNEEYLQQLKEMKALKTTFSSITAQNVLSANIIATSPAGSGADTCDIDKGYLDGVATNMIVLSDLAPLGRIFYVGPKSSKVRLITDRDRSMRINARIDRETADGFMPIVDECQVYGIGNGELRCNDVSIRRTIEPQVGDIFRVRDKEWRQVPGAVIGTVVGVSRKDNQNLRYEIKIAPRININHTDRVVVLMVK